MAEVRYIVSDVDAAVAFYTLRLGFKLTQQYGPAIAIVSRGDLTHWLAGPPSNAAKPMPAHAGRRTACAGWMGPNRAQS